MIIIQVAVVENEAECARQTEEMIHRWKREQDVYCELKVDFFSNGEDFIKSKTDEYHIAFLDIQLDGKLNGIETAQLLRQSGCDVPLVFLTSYSQYVFTGYEVRALNYIVKPVEFERVAWCMNRIFELEFQGYYIFKEKDNLHKLSYNKILYFQSSLHYIDIFTKKNAFRQKMSFKKLQMFLPPQFVQCHRTVIVNILKIDYINGREIMMVDGTYLPISSTYLELVRNMYLTLMMEDK